MLIKPSIRTTDKWGEGRYGASRGNRKHNGVDLNCYPGSTVLSPLRGKITKYGYPYSDDLKFRYIEITNDDDLRFRFFYVAPNPDIEVGDDIHHHMPIGVVQDLTQRYPGITNHVHFEVKDRNGDYINPTDFL